MNDNTFKMIDSYLDGELNRSDEDILFEQLAVNPEAREYLRKVNFVGNQTRLSAAEFPSPLEQNILNSVNKRTASPFTPAVRLTGYFAAGISVILLIVTLFLLGQVSEYRTEIKTVLNHMEKQDQVIEALYNSYPAAEVKAEYSNEIIVKPKI
jgi:anti-sigma factor RsiW